MTPAEHASHVWQRVERAALGSAPEGEPEEPGDDYPPFPPGGVSLRDEMHLVERALIERALRRAHGVQAEAARLLDIERSTLAYKLRKHHPELHPAARATSQETTAP